MSEYYRNYYKANREYFLQYSRKWQKEKGVEYRLQRYADPTNREKKRACDLRYQKNKRATTEGYKAKESADYRQKYPEKYRAQQTLNRYLKMGRVNKLPCAYCGAEKVHAHHPDYTKPLEVIWVCPIHHKQIHSRANH